jgi:hypothetical protein
MTDANTSATAWISQDTLGEWVQRFLSAELAGQAPSARRQLGYKWGYYARNGVRGESRIPRKLAPDLRKRWSG